MRVLVFLLVLGNLLFYAWSHDYLGTSGNSDAKHAGRPLRAEQIRIVANDEPPSDKARREAIQEKADASAPTESCLVLGEMPLSDIESVESVIAEKFPAFRKTRITTTPGISSYWLHIPPQKTKREAEAKAAELQALRVREYYIVQESGSNNLAISLGLYSTREGADSALEMFRKKGVRSAQIIERTGRTAQAQLELHGPEEQVELLRSTVGQAAPQARFGSCKERSAGG
jgi:hypothetical protein